MDDDRQSTNRRKTLDDVQEERRLERIEGAQDPILKRELNDLKQARVTSLSELSETQKDTRPLREQEVRAWGRSPSSTAPAEVTLQFEGQLRGEANRHNKLIDDKLQAHDEIYGKQFDENRYAADHLYSRVIDEEIQREHVNKLQAPTNTPGPKSSLEAAQQEHPQVAVDHGRLGTDPDYRNQILNNEELHKRQQAERQRQASEPGGTELSATERLDQALDKGKNAVTRPSADAPKPGAELSATERLDQALDGEKNAMSRPVTEEPKIGVELSATERLDQDLKNEREISNAPTHGQQRPFKNTKRSVTGRFGR